jgi:diguanylate cyclase (GGDEF)-like protein
MLIMDRQRVLIIDDDRDMANLFHTVLSMVGFDCEVVYTAKDGLSKLTINEPDMVLLDMRLGFEIGGDDILYQIRSNPRLKNTRVIVITGYPSMAEPVADLADLILLKPIEIDQLRNLVLRLARTEPAPKPEYFRDPVTGLYNQDFFMTRLEQAFERTKRRLDFQFAAFIVDIDVLPPPSGEITGIAFDRIVREVAGRLANKFRPTDTIARLSGKRFATLHEDLKDPGDVQSIGSRLYVELSRPYQVAKVTYQVAIKLGAACHDPAFQTPTDILQAAEKDQHIWTLDLPASNV